MRLYLYVWMSMCAVPAREKHVGLAEGSLETSRWGFLKSHQAAQPIIFPHSPLKGRCGYFGVTANILLRR